MPEQPYVVRNGIICASVTAASVLASWPFAEMGFVDDWSYVKTAFVFGLPFSTRNDPLPCCTTALMVEQHG
jgi:hypothetical protein